MGILPPSSGAWKRGTREDLREQDFTHPCNRWMKCGPVCVCQSSKASGESRPGAHLSFSARSKGGDHSVAVDLPSWVLATECKASAEKKRASQAVRQEKEIY